MNRPSAALSATDTTNHRACSLYSCWKAQFDPYLDSINFDTQSNILAELLKLILQPIRELIGFLRLQFCSISVLIIDRALAHFLQFVEKEAAAGAYSPTGQHGFILCVNSLCRGGVCLCSERLASLR